MDGRHRDRSPLRRIAAAMVGTVLFVIGVAAVARGSDNTVEPDPEPAVEVCDATEYEGCPARWEYLWAED